MTPNGPNGYDVIIVGAGPAGLCAAMYAGTLLQRGQLFEVSRLTKLRAV